MIKRILIYSLVLITAVTFAKKKEKSPEKLLQKAIKLYKKGKYAKAKPIFEELRDKNIFNEIGTMAHFYLAETLYKMKKYEEAEIEYELFINYHPTYDKLDYIFYKMAKSKEKLILSIDRDQKPTKDALQTFRDFLTKFPHSSYYEDALVSYNNLYNHLMRHNLYVGKFYYKTKLYSSAIKRLKYVIENSKNNQILTEANYYLGMCYLKRGNQKLAEKFLGWVILNGENKFKKKASKKLLKYFKK